MKTVNEILTKLKGAGKENTTITGKGAFSAAGWNGYFNALANDKTFKVTKYNKDGTTTAISISDAIREDFKKTAKNANFPGPTEIDKYDTCDIVTTGTAKIIGDAIVGYMETGRKFDFPPNPNMNASIYLATIPPGTKTTAVRHPQTKEDLGTSTTTNKEYIRMKAKSTVPPSKQTKVRKDTKGNIIK